jgi:DNA gyrase/topoisomerase IV subunit A
VLGLVEKGDELLFAAFAADAADILFGTTAGQLLRTPAADVNPQASDSARGVAGIGLKGADKLPIGGVVPAEAFDKTAVYSISSARRAWSSGCPWRSTPPRAAARAG